MRAIYNNNADVELHEPSLTDVQSSRTTAALPDGSVENITSVYDSIVYIGMFV